MKKFNLRSKSFTDLKLLDENFIDDLRISINLTISIYQIFFKAWNKYRVLKAIGSAEPGPARRGCMWYYIS